MTLDSSATNENHMFQETSYNSPHNRLSNKCDAISNFGAHDRLWGWGGNIMINKLPVTLVEAAIYITALHIY